MSLFGWEPIIPQVASFLVLRNKQKDRMVPFNMFMVGPKGNGKTTGSLHLLQSIGLKVGLIDMSTLDDIAELAGIIDIGANRNDSKSKIISGELLEGKDVLIADEFLNTRPHVVAQSRLLLQGYLVLLGKSQRIDVKNFIGLGNLTEHMEQGEANTLDSPTADRFAIVVEVPSLANLSTTDRMAIYTNKTESPFEVAFQHAYKGIEQNYDAAMEAYQQQIAIYVDTLVTELGRSQPGESQDMKRKKAVFAFQGRRAQMLMQFVAAAIALCEAEPKRDQKETVWTVAKDCLSYHRLSGLDLDMALLKTSHEMAYQRAFIENGIETLIANEAELGAQIAIMMQYLPRVSPVTKADLMGKVIASDDFIIKLAAKDLVVSPVFAKESPALRELVDKIDISKIAPAHTPSAQNLQDISMMSPAESLAFGLCGCDHAKKNDMMAKVNEHLVRWGVITADKAFGESESAGSRRASRR